MDASKDKTLFAATRLRLKDILDLWNEKLQIILEFNKLLSVE